jgi:hypothetical protein
MTRFFPFTPTAPQNFQNDVTSTSNNYDSYTNIVNITPTVTNSIATGLGALQLALQNVLSDNSPANTISNNLIVAALTITTAISLALQQIYKSKQSSANTDLTKLINQGIQLKYLDPNATNETVVAVAPIAGAPPLTAQQQIEADGMVRRLTR